MKKPKGFGKFDALARKLVKVKPESLPPDPVIEALIDAAFTVLAHDISPTNGGEEQEAYEVQSAALRERFKEILK